jgi:hypothetical protein
LKSAENQAIDDNLLLGRQAAEGLQIDLRDDIGREVLLPL